MELRNYLLLVFLTLHSIFLIEFDAAGSGSASDRFQQYVKQGQEAVLQCSYERSRLKWVLKNGTIIASANTVIDPTKYKVSVTSTGLYYRLHVLNTQPDDEDIYVCKGGIFEEYYIQLNLYVPPTLLYFHGLIDNKLEGTEGVDLLLRCIADGGKPPPDVSIIDGTRPSKTQEVSYTIPSMTRDYHQKIIVCQAISDALVNPMTTTVQIYLNLKPLTPIFDTNEVSTEETVPLTISCTSYGSRPAATFTWTISGNDVTSSSTTSQPVRESNDTNTVTSTFTSSLNRIHNNHLIICHANNTVGSVSASKILHVKYAPNITVNSPTYTQNEADRTVTCNPIGNPDSYTYHKWQHKSRLNGEIIREFGGNKTLKLPDVSVEYSYQDTGDYVCSADNGIKDEDYQLEQTGVGYVTINAQPVFTSDTIKRVKQFGEIDKTVDIYVNVYSVPKFTSYIWARDRIPITQNSAKYQSSSSVSIVKDTFHGKGVQLNGYNVTLTIHNLKAEDFSNYTVTLENGFGSSTYNITLESVSRPDIPGNFSMITSSSTSITVQWDPNSGGGYKQTFYIQYRAQGSSEWTIVSAGEEDTNEQRRRRTYEVKRLQEGKAYELRMFSENTAMKRSNFTDVLIELTRSSDSGSSTGAVIGGVAGCLIAIIIVVLVIVCVLKKRKDGLKDNILYESSQSDVLKTDALCQSAGPDFESQNKTATSCEYAVVQKPNAIYAEVNKDAQPKKVKAKKQKVRKEKPKKDTQVKPKAVNNNPEDEYANSALPLQNLNEGEYSNSTDAQGPSGHHTNAQGLEYADLTFRQIPAKNKKQVIHGKDDRTIYADVDHTKKAPPPPQESEYEETNIKHGKMA